MPLDDFDPGFIPGLDDHHPSIPSIITPIEEDNFPHDISTGQKKIKYSFYDYKKRKNQVFN